MLTNMHKVYTIYTTISNDRNMLYKYVYLDNKNKMFYIVLGVFVWGSE
jgi:hypothetical protein